MKGDTFADDGDIVWRANCWLEDYHQKLFYNKIPASGRQMTKCILVADKYAKKQQKYDAYLFCITMSIYKLFNRQSYICRLLIQGGP